MVEQPVQPGPELRLDGKAGARRPGTADLVLVIRGSPRGDSGVAHAVARGAGSHTANAVVRFAPISGT